MIIDARKCDEGGAFFNDGASLSCFYDCVRQKSKTKYLSGPLKAYRAIQGKGVSARREVAFSKAGYDEATIDLASHRAG